MRSIEYDIEHFDLPGPSLSSLQLIKSEDCKDCWEARTQRVTFTVAFRETEICEIKMNILTSVIVRVEAGRDRLMRDKVVLVDRRELIDKKEGKKVRYEVPRLYQDSRFSRAVISFDSLDTKSSELKVGYVCFYQPECTDFEGISEPVKRPRLVDLPGAILKPPILKPTPPPRVSLDISLQLLNDCTVTTLGYCEHVQTLCKVLGASYLDHIEKRTTHIIIPPSSSYDDEALYDTTAKLVSVGWLEKCLHDKARQSEEDYELL